MASCKVLVLGGSGQLGRQLLRSLPDWITATAPQSSALNVCDREAIQGALSEHTPDWVVNAAAMTAVDRAEVEPELAWAVNFSAAQTVAAATAETNARLLQVSTDFVFSGAAGVPYREDDQAGPINVYGASKLAGELAACQATNAVVMRTSWLYGAESGFVGTVRRRALLGEPLRVVGDQIGTPTSVETAANAIVELIKAAPHAGVYHLADLGAATWFDLASAAVSSIPSADLKPITTAEYPNAIARRPADSRLDSSHLRSVISLPERTWHESLAGILGDQ